MKKSATFVLATVLATAALSADCWSKLKEFGQAIDGFLPAYVTEEESVKEVDSKEQARLDKERLLQERKEDLAQRQAVLKKRAELRAQQRQKTLVEKHEKEHLAAQEREKVLIEKQRVLEHEQKALAAKQARLERAEKLRQEREKLRMGSEEEIVLDVEDTVVSEDKSDEIQLIEFFSGIRRVAAALKQHPYVINNQVNNERIKGAIHFVKAFAVHINNREFNKQFKSISDAYQRMVTSGPRKNRFRSVCNTYAKISNLYIEIDESMIRKVLEKELIRLQQSAKNGHVASTLGSIYAMYVFLIDQDPDLFHEMEKLKKRAYRRAKKPKTFHHLAKEFTPVIEAVKNSNIDLGDE